MSKQKLHMKIVTHPGPAHMDEFLACCYLLALYPECKVIERHDPTEQELLATNVWVIDVGGQHDSLYRNFDHHQIPRDADPTCALSMVLKEHQDYSDWCSVFPWLKVTEMMDSKGPFAVAKKMGVDPDKLMALSMNPIVGFVLQRFAECSGCVRGAMHGHVFEMMHELGLYLVEKIDKCRDTWAKLDEAGELIKIGTDVYALDARRLGEDTTGLESWCQRQAHDIAAYVAIDNRGDGLAFVRRNDHPMLDFSKAEHLSECHFAHANGWVFKTKTQEACLIQVLAAAIT